MALDTDNAVYHDDDPRSRRNQLSIVRGANHITVWSNRLMAIGWEHRGALEAMVAIGLAITATYVAQGFLVAAALGQVLVDGDTNGVAALLVAAVALTLARSALVWWRESLGAVMGERVCASLRARLYHQLVRLGPAWLEQTRTGALQATLTTAVESLEKYFRLFLSQAIVAAVGATAVVVYLATIDPVVGLFVGSTALVSALGPILGWRMLGPRVRFWWVESPQLGAEYVDSLQGMPTLKAFGAAGSRRQKLVERTRGVRDAAMGILRTEIAAGTPGGLMSTAGMVLAGGIASLRLTQGALDARELLVVLILARECFRPVAELRLALHFSYQGIVGAERILDVLDAEPAVGGVGTLRPSTAVPRLRFEAVAFTYPTADRPAVADLSFEVSAGEHVAIVGRSGAGKSTVVGLLLRFFDPSAGRILLDDHELGTLDVGWYRSQVALVSQDTYLFHGTVLDNLLLARPAATAAEVRDACRVANAAEFIEALPLGYDTVVGERGARLSGGQRQRVAIARAVLKDAPVLVLDEATSNVDVASEAAIHQALDRLTEGRTTLVVAHRLSTVRNADRILVLEGGRLVEEGDHTGLDQAGGAYHRLVRAQEAR